MLARIERILRRLFLANAKKGPYRFIISKLEETSFKLAQDILSTEYFKDESTPLELPIGSFNKYLVIAPHQDDETIGLGGLLIKLRDLGKEISIVYITDGGQPSHPLGLEKILETRHREAQQVCTELNANMFCVDVSNQTLEIEKKHLKKLADIIGETKPDVVFVPWLLDFPPRHKLTNHMLVVTNKLFNLPDFEIWGYQVHSMLYPNAYVNISNEIEEKKKLLKIFESQNTFAQAYDHMTIGMNAWNSRFIPFDNTSKPVYVELFFTLPKAEYLKLVNKFYSKSLQAAYGANTMSYRSAKRLVEIV